jgi:prepilin-type N-terminal cleavage/methylation domain-containing protein
MQTGGKEILTRQTRHHGNAFTLVEVLISLAIFGMMVAGLIYGYVQADKFAEWSSMSYAAQSYAVQGMEQVRDARWETDTDPVTDLLAMPVSGVLNFTETNTMDVPSTGAPYNVVDNITVTTITNAADPTLNLRMIRVDCVWVFPLTKKTMTNTVITYRAPDEF